MSAGSSQRDFSIPYSFIINKLVLDPRTRDWGAYITFQSRHSSIPQLLSGIPYSQFWSFHPFSQRPLPTWSGILVFLCILLFILLSLLFPSLYMCTLYPFLSFSSPSHFSPPHSNKSTHVYCNLACTGSFCLQRNSLSDITHLLPRKSLDVWFQILRQGNKLCILYTKADQAFRFF